MKQYACTYTHALASTQSHPQYVVGLGVREFPLDLPLCPRYVLPHVWWYAYSI